MDMHAFWIVVLGIAVTVATRFLPFLIFGRGRKVPAYIDRLRKVLPYAVMGMLVVYCLKDVSWLEKPFGIPEIIGCLTVAGLHIWRRNTLLSIGGGTLLYMVLVQLVFR